MSKGSRQRPRKVSADQFSKNWDAIFKAKKKVNKTKEVVSNELVRK